MVAVMRLPVGPHPHSHGENGMFTPPVYSFAGSSPLTRGKLDPQSDQRNAHGLIPAHTGKTCGHHCRGGVARPHPRSRGENCPACAREPRKCGSSPLTRGKQPHADGDFEPGRLIPAHAGKTFRLPFRRVRGRAHPSSRGENHWLKGKTETMGASSPLTRGKPWGRVPHHCPRRLIPAHAGKTCSGRRKQPRTRAHPRSRGENHPSHQAAASRMGSSPLTRGKRRRPHPPPPRCRLIPAHAGKTSWARPASSSGTAHPRSRGENAGPSGWLQIPTGSCPLTRGKPIRCQPEVQKIRLIPAHAGKTMGSSPTPLPTAAHPRSRGENGVSPVVPTNQRGSSPLTRGKLLAPPMPRGRTRLIPAHAGKTSVIIRHAV